MIKEEKFFVKGESLNKALHKLVLYSVKIIPVVISGIYILNTVLSYFYIDLPLLSYDSIEDYISSIVHEAEHVKQAMLMEYKVEDKGEPPAYTIGYLVKEMWEVFGNYI